MSEETCDYCAKAKVPISKDWHEREVFWRWIPMAFGLTSWYFLYHLLGISSNIWLSIVSVVCVLAAWTIDTFTTAVLFQLKPQFDQRGLDFPVVEANPHLPDFPTLREQIVSWPTILESLFLLGSFYMPPLGFCLALSHLVAAFGNWTEKRRLSSTLQDINTTTKATTCQ